MDLRRQFDRIGEIPSLISDKRVMPLAATASTSAAEEIIKSLCMTSVIQVKHNPGRPNIFLACQQNYAQQSISLEQLLTRGCMQNCWSHATGYPKKSIIIYFCWAIEMTCIGCMNTLKLILEKRHSLNPHLITFQRIICCYVPQCECQVSEGGCYALS